MSRTRRSATTLVVSTLGSFVSIVVGFVTTPALLAALGSEKLGLFRLHTDWNGYVALLEGGVSGALSPLIVASIAGGDRGEASRVVAKGFRTYLGVAIITLVAGILLLLAFPRLTVVPPTLVHSLRLGMGISLLSCAVIPLLAYRAVAEAMQQGYVVSLLLMVQGLVIAVGSVVAARAGLGLPGQFGVAAAAGLILPLGLFLRFSGQFPIRAILANGGGGSNTSAVLRSRSRATIVTSILGRIALASDTVVAGFLLGPTAVVSYVFSSKLIQVTGGQVTLLGGATWAGLAELFESGAREQFRLRLIELTRLTAILSATLVLPLGLLSRPFIGLWLHDTSVYAGPLFVTMCVVATVLQSVLSLWGWTFSGTGRIGTMVPYLAIQASLNLSISVVATRLFGVAGPLIGTVAVGLTFNLWRLTRLMSREFGLHPTSLLAAAAFPLSAAVPSLALLWLSQRFVPEYGWFRLGLEYTLAVAVTGSVAWSTMLSHEERSRYRDVVTGAWTRRFVRGGAV